MITASKEQTSRAVPSEQRTAVLSLTKVCPQSSGMINNSEQKTALTTTRPTKKQDWPAAANAHDDASDMTDSSKGNARTRQRVEVGEKTTGSNTYSSSYIVDVHAAINFNGEGGKLKATAQKVAQVFYWIYLQQNKVQAQLQNTVPWSTRLDNCCCLLGAIDHAPPSMRWELRTEFRCWCSLFGFSPCVWTKGRFCRVCSSSRGGDSPPGVKCLLPSPQICQMLQSLSLSNVLTTHLIRSALACAEKNTHGYGTKVRYCTRTPKERERTYILA